MKNNTEYLFVYGTLRKGVELPINKQIQKHLEWIGQAEMQGELFDIGEYPGAKQLSNDVESFIKGDVFKILDQKVLKVLDDYEGFYANEPDSSEYLRKDEMLELDGKKIIVWLYWYNRSTDNKIRIRHKDYLEYLKTKKTA